ncbi:hypothetical protein K435DRAFT_958980 [Dendrothele bispora CBS 962.96]|uniref:Mid2 domain-containing protein n=1 Tax=Dendrothele bispora (strain CBS 962.96) TaxID=1314807 RepID=A0A4S8MYA7_DENBC|nr:hypothetical protein K435DRAFT_958980 [Dendrothele bispora CBS 962.96]
MSTTILATYPQITYNPPGNWDSFGSSKSTFHSGSSASLSFTGSQVDIFGNFTQTTSNSHRSSGSSTPQPTSYSSPDSSTGSTARSGNSSSSKANIIGRIVGGVIAGLVVLACLVVFLLYRRRKRVKAARRASPFAVTPFITEFSKPSSPEPLKSIPTTGAVPTLPFASPPIITELDHGDELPPAFIAGPSDLGRHGSMYKPRQSVDSLPPTEFGYGGGMSREEWARYTLKSKS